MVFLWFSYGFPNVFPWFVSLWFALGFPVVFPFSFDVERNNVKATRSAHMHTRKHEDRGFEPLMKLKKRGWPLRIDQEYYADHSGDSRMELAALPGMELAALPAWSWQRASSL